MMMLRLQSIFICLVLMKTACAQELYVFTNPASNIPAKAMVAKLSSKTMESYHNLRREFRISPEAQVGITKNFMMAGGLSFSNMFFQDGIAYESVKLYASIVFTVMMNCINISGLLFLHRVPGAKTHWCILSLT
ncbi:MAG: hypothetical protein K2X48_09300 [Chitinophagaceae bacterium]|nr:hypothetical protein [Chitinophagaceae bacterium]